MGVVIKLLTPVVYQGENIVFEVSSDEKKTLDYMVVASVDNGPERILLTGTFKSFDSRVVLPTYGINPGSHKIVIKVYARPSSEFPWELLAVGTGIGLLLLGGIRRERRI